MGRLVCSSHHDCGPLRVRSFPHPCATQTSQEQNSIDIIAGRIVEHLEEKDPLEASCRLISQQDTGLSMLMWDAIHEQVVMQRHS